MAEKLRGYKTIITGAFLVAYALAAVIGAPVPNPDGEAALALTGALMVILRFVTNGPALNRDGE